LFQMDLEKIRTEFPVTEELIFFDHARVAPLPKCVRKAVTAFVDNATLYGTAHYENWIVEIEKSRKNFSHLINAGTREGSLDKQVG
jgi:cysteine desulfurase/selenocysteine lyase